MDEKELNDAINLLIKYITDDEVEEIESVDNGLMEIRDLVR
jgi:hypothetical protein